MVQGNPHIKMTTSVIDYVFRELAITYLGRSDLAQVTTEDLRGDTTGRPDKEPEFDEDGSEFITEREIDPDEARTRMEVPRSRHLNVGFAKEETASTGTTETAAAPSTMTPSSTPIVPKPTSAATTVKTGSGSQGGNGPVIAHSATTTGGSGGGLGMASSTPMPALVLPGARVRAAAASLGLPATSGVVERERVRQARIKGYEGDPCGECGQFTMVRNGTCLKCLSCGATNGCS